MNVMDVEALQLLLLTYSRRCMTGFNRASHSWRMFGRYNDSEFQDISLYTNRVRCPFSRQYNINTYIFFRTLFRKSYRKDLSICLNSAVALSFKSMFTLNRYQKVLPITIGALLLLRLYPWLCLCN